MKLIPPTVITSAMLTDSDVVESGYTLWDSGTTYSTLGTEAALALSGEIVIYEAIRLGNKLSYPEQFDNAVWNKTGLTVTANAAVAPDGTTTADLLTEDSSTGQHVVYYPLTGQPAETRSGGLHLKYGSRRYVSVRYDNGATPTAVIDLTTGAIVVGTGVAVESEGGGWYRIIATKAVTAGAHYLSIDFLSGATIGSYSYAGDGTSGVYAWGASLNPGTVAESYIPGSTAATVNLNRSPDAAPLWWKERCRTYPAYSGATSYALAARVVDTTGHRVFESLQAVNSGHALSDVAWWLDVGPTNRWAPFDARVGTAATRIGSMVYELEPGSIDALAVVDTDAEVVNVTMMVGIDEVYSASQSTNEGGSAINDWYLYFVAPLGKRTALTFLDLPVYPTGVLTVEIVGVDPDAAVSVGTLIVGRQMYLGSTEAGVKAGMTSFSKKSVDDFGVTSVVARPWAKRMVLRTLCNTDDVEAIYRALISVRDTPALWIGEEGFGVLLVYGFFKDFEIDLAIRNISYVSLTIEGLT